MIRSRALAYYATRDLIPFYGVYALLFADHGLSASAISSLLIIWSAVSFLSEVPSGAWADVIDRRLLLVGSGLLFATGFATWVLWPTYAGFALGFVLWGVSGSLMSGTFESLLYDALVDRGEERGYARLMGWAAASQVVAATVGIAVASPLFRLGGYPLVGWVSVGIALVHAALAATLPDPPRSGTTADDDDDDPFDGTGFGGSTFARWLMMLRAGLREVTSRATVRRLGLIAAALMGISAYDEYFGLLAREAGVATADIALLVALVGLGEVVGAAFAGRTEAWSGSAMAAAVVVAALSIAIGAASGHPVGFFGVAVGYGIAHNAIVVGEARLQAAITGPARATVTSVTGFLAEVFAVLCYAAFALGSIWWSIGTIMAMMCLPLVAIAVGIRAWWPRHPTPSPPNS